MRRIALLSLLACCLGAEAPAQKALLSPDAVARSLMYVLSFDRSQKERLNKGFTVAVFYDSRVRSSRSTARAIAGALPGAASSVHSRVRVVSVDVNTRTDLAARLRESGAGVVYVAPLASAGVARVADACRAAGILTFTGVAKYVTRGVAVGLVQKDGEVEILINLAASRAVGSVFRSQLLRVARMVE